MLNFRSASVRIANSERAVEELIDIAYEGSRPEGNGVIIFNAAMGHKLDKVAAALKKQAPQSAILGTSCGGIIGREGAGEAMTHLAIMAIHGPEEELAAVSADDINGHNSYEKGLELARALKAKLPNTSMVYLLCTGMDISADCIIGAFNEVFGNDMPVFGGTSADNYKAIATYQYTGEEVTQHGAWAVGMADPTLKAVCKASHGFCAYGEPMTVTVVEDNNIIEIDDSPAWQAYMNRLSLIPKDDPTQTLLTVGALASELPEEIAREYGNPHILRGAFNGYRSGVMYMAISVREGDRFWLTTRDEDLIFSEQEKALEYMKKELNGHKPVAVFQADCLARGRTLFNKVMKDELTGMMQSALLADDEVTPWIGMYGFGEFCPLGGKNAFHTYTTSLMALYR